MKKLVVLAACILISGSSFGQNAGTKTEKPMTPAQKKAADLRKNAVGGYIRDARNRPLEGVQAFIYQHDSANSIIASGYTDVTGYYETNSVMPGKYNIKIVYPNNKSIMVPEVMMKKGITDISIKSEAPTTDTSISFAVFQPKPQEKPKKK